MTNAVPASKSRLIVKRDGRAITGKVPKPQVIVDTREQDPFCFEAHENWIAGAHRGTLRTGDYTCVGMEAIMTMERKSLHDIVGTLMHHRQRFFAECERMASMPYKCILIEASYEDLKSPYRFPGAEVEAHPNGVCGSLDAVEAKFGIPIIYTSRIRALAQERAASWLSKHFTYWWLETQGKGRVLQEGDL